MPGVFWNSSQLTDKFQNLTCEPAEPLYDCNETWSCTRGECLNIVLTTELIWKVTPHETPFRLYPVFNPLISNPLDSLSYEGLAFNISKKLEFFFDIKFKGLKDESKNILYYTVNNSNETTQTKN